MSIIKVEPLSEFDAGDVSVKQEFLEIPPNEHELSKTSNTSVQLNSSEHNAEFQIDQKCVIIPKIKSVETLKDPLSLSDCEANPTTNHKNDVRTRPTTKRKRIKNKPPTASCSECNKAFNTFASFERHMSQVHKVSHPYPCTICGRSFGKRETRTKHEVIHDTNRSKGEPKFTCDICGKRFHISGTMRSHKARFHFGYKTPSRILVGSFKCTICAKTLTTKNSLKSHIRFVHERPTPTGIVHPRPKYQQGQACPCKICGKGFPVPSLLSEHILLHTGEKPYSCETCHQKFRWKKSLRRHIEIHHLKDKLLQNKLKLFKCRICGRDDFLYLGVLQQHWKWNHGHNSSENEKMKPFACGICGKPYYLREGALICAILGHDPTKFRKEMFKFKCPECPDEEILGFYNLSMLRKHWYDNHGDKKLPGKFLGGILPKNCDIVKLPVCKIDKMKMKEIQVNGPPQIKSEYPLYTELDLLPIATQHQDILKKRQIKKNKVFQTGKSRYGTFTCTICGLKTCRKDTLKKHIAVVHNSGKYRMEKEDLLKNIGQSGNIGTVIIDVDSGVIVKQEVNEYHENSQTDLVKNSDENIFNCRFCKLKWSTVRGLRMHEVKKHLSLRSNVNKHKTAKMKPKRKMKTKNCVNKTGGISSSVSVNDQIAIDSILNFQSVQVRVTRL